MELPPLLIQSAVSLAAILALAGLAWWLKLGGAPALDCAEAVRRAVAALPEDLRTPLILAEYEERSQAEIGEMLGCTAKAVELRIYRARQQLRVSLGKFLEFV